MEMKNAILELRKVQNLSQDEFAEKLFVTRQAVSRWENGETIPNIDTLKLIAEIFSVSVDHLLGHPAKLCQSCGISLELDNDRGTDKNDRISEEYCAFCFQHGAFTQDLSIEAMIEHNLQGLDEWNKSAGLNLTKEEARIQLLEFLPTLKRWRT